jgi:hypothetical protein
MPHTNAWNVTDPPGTEQAKNIDDHIRRLRVDLGDRLADLVVDVMADPLKLKADAQDPVVDKQLIIPFSDFMVTTNGKEAEFHDGYCLAYTDTGLLMCPVQVPVGCTITKVEVLVDVADADSINWSFDSRSFAAGGGRPASQTAQVILANGNVAGAGVKIGASGVLAVLVSAAQMYYIAIDGVGANGNSYDLYGARVTYTSPSAATVR